MMADLPRCAKVPCGSCPYRRDVPSGVWAPDEYAKLPDYDGETGEQAMAGAIGLFMCHQRDGHLCAGWVACHDTDHLLALRVSPVDPSVFDYTTDVPVFDSGAEAAAHGMRDIAEPSDAARKVQDSVTKLVASRAT